MRIEDGPGGSVVAALHGPVFGHAGEFGCCQNRIRAKNLRASEIDLQPVHAAADSDPVGGRAIEGVPLREKAVGARSRDDERRVAGVGGQVVGARSIGAVDAKDRLTGVAGK